MIRTLLFFLIALFVTTGIVIATPKDNPIQIIKEGLFECGYECDSHDGCTGNDESWGWSATGNLKPGESWTYIPEEPGCGDRHVSRAIKGRVQWKGNLDLEIVITDEDKIGEGTYFKERGMRNLKACVDGTYSPYWSVTITNTGIKQQGIYS